MEDIFPKCLFLESNKNKKKDTPFLTDFQVHRLGAAFGLLEQESERERKRETNR